MYKHKLITFFMAVFFLIPTFLVSAAGGKQTKSGEVNLTTRYIMDSTAMFDQSDPEKRSYDDNRYITTFRNVLGVNLKSKWIAPDSASDTAKWGAAIASGDVPDFAVVDNNIYKQLYEADLIADMTKIFPENASDAIKGFLDETSYKLLTLDGKLLGFPLSGNSYLDGVLFVRQDWLDILGLQVPKTIEDVIVVARAFKAAKLNGNDTIGLLFYNNNGWSANGIWTGFFNGYGAYPGNWIVKNGQLAYGTVQNEVRDALLSMQTLYKEGTINKDMPAVTDTVASEYIASGKVGIWYGISWTTTTSILTLTGNDPNAKVINLFYPSVKGKSYPMQVGLPGIRKVFVSNKCAHPDMVVKMANLTLQYQQEKYRDYEVGDDGFLWYKFPVWSHIQSNFNDLEMADNIRQAEQTGKTISIPQHRNVYGDYLAEKSGKISNGFFATFGPGGSYTTLFDAWKANKMQPNAYAGLPTETMSLKQQVLDNNLLAAMTEVILGTDISVYDKAVKDWFNNGGQQITDEVNRWYKGNK
jgi:putative aldouronate transport system substrate-binding protein